MFMAPCTCCLAPGFGFFFFLPIIALAGSCQLTCPESRDANGPSMFCSRPVAGPEPVEGFVVGRGIGHHRQTRANFGDSTPRAGETFDTAHAMVEAHKDLIRPTRWWRPIRTAVHFVGTLLRMKVRTSHTPDCLSLQNCH
jgi:hypothetical protein